jgi:L-rhamnose mutarotase
MPKYSLSLILAVALALAGCSNSQDRGTITDRYCLALDLKPDSELIREYRHLHSKEGMWKEIPKGIKEAGCLDMEIYLIDNHMFMIVEVPKGEELDSVWEKMGKLEKQGEWAEYMLKFQKPLDGHGNEVRWILMEKVYDLDEHF